MRKLLANLLVEAEESLSSHVKDWERACMDYEDTLKCIIAALDDISDNPESVFCIRGEYFTSAGDAITLRPELGMKIGLHKEYGGDWAISELSADIQIARRVA